MDSLNPSNSVGIDLGILNYIHTSDGKTVDWLNLEGEYERLRRAHRHSRGADGFDNYEIQTSRSGEGQTRHPPESTGLPAQNNDVFAATTISVSRRTNVSRRHERPKRSEQEPVRVGWSPCITPL